ncbi:MAG TPA: hypothetical protein PLC86_07695 [Candidatus Accumulibacter phosphatis]|nr:hypothetical protein [Candidatus Accumulibacter phosphatis]
MKARLPVLEHVGKLHLHRAGHVVADQFAQVPLTRHKADQGHRSIGIGCLDQFRELRPFAADKRDVRCPTRQPENQFVEEEDYAVVAEFARVAGKDGESIVEADKGLTLATATTAGDRGVGAEETRNQVTDQTATLVTPR